MPKKVFRRSFVVGVLKQTRNKMRFSQCPFFTVMFFLLFWRICLLDNFFLDNLFFGWPVFGHIFFGPFVFGMICFWKICFFNYLFFWATCFFDDLLPLSQCGEKWRCCSTFSHLASPPPILPFPTTPHVQGWALLSLVYCISYSRIIWEISYIGDIKALSWYFIRYFKRIKMPKK